MLNIKLIKRNFDGGRYCGKKGSRILSRYPFSLAPSHDDNDDDEIKNLDVG